MLGGWERVLGGIGGGCWRERGSLQGGKGGEWWHWGKEGGRHWDGGSSVSSRADGKPVAGVLSGVIMTQTGMACGLV